MIKCLLMLLLSTSSAQNQKPRDGCQVSENWYCLTRQCTTLCKKLTCCLNGLCSTTNSTCKTNPRHNGRS